MRNLKRVLSLGLASVMLMGMMIVGAGAASKDFTDASEIKNVEAVDVMVALGVLEGGDKGDFQPNSILTREQAAKIICYLLLGEESAEKLATNSAVFNDVAADRWSAPFIGYCVNLGILAGDGNGNFFPEGKLTGAAFAKMLLVALGYDPAIEKYTGSDWTINVAGDAIEAGISPKGLVLTNELSRQDAAQMAFQTLSADMVYYASKGTTIIGSDGMQVITGNTPAAATGKTFAEKYFADLTKGTGTDSFGRPGTKWTYDKEEIGVYASAADYTYVLDEDYTSTTPINMIKDLTDDDTLAMASTKTFAVNGDTTAESADVKAASNVGAVVEIYLNDNGKVSSVVVYNYVLAVVDSVSEYDSEDEMADKYGASVEYTLTNLGGTTYDDMVYVDTLSKDKNGTQAIGSYDEGDVLAVVMTNTGKIIDKAVAEEVSGVMTAKGDGYIKVDGTQYTAIESAKAPNFDDTYTYYMDPNDVVIGSELYEEADAALEYVYVLKAEKETSDDNSILNGGEDRAVVKVMYTDGTTAVLDYALTKTSSDDYASGYYFKVGSHKYDLSAFDTQVTEGWYAYTMNSSDEITLKSADKADVSKKLAVNVQKDDRTIASGLYATTSTVVTVYNEDGIANTYKGYANFPSTAISENALVVYGTSNKYAANVYVYDEDATTDTAKVDVALFVSAGDTTADGVVCTFYVDGEKVTYTVDADDEALGTAVAGQLFEIDVDEDIASLSALTKGTDYAYGTVGLVSDDYIVVDSRDIDLAADCAVYQVSSNNKTVSTGTLAEDQNVVVFTNDDGAYLVFIYKNAPSAVTGE